MKNLLNLGKALNKMEQKQINGGKGGPVCAEMGIVYDPVKGEICTCIDWLDGPNDGTLPPLAPPISMGCGPDRN